MLGVCKYIKNQILAELHFGALCLNRQYRRISVTTKYKYYNNNNNNNRLYFERVTHLVTKLIFHEALFYIQIYKDKRINSQTWTD